MLLLFAAHGSTDYLQEFVLRHARSEGVTQGDLSVTKQTHLRKTSYA